MPAETDGQIESKNCVTVRGGDKGMGALKWAQRYSFPEYRLLRFVLLLVGLVIQPSSFCLLTCLKTCSRVLQESAMEVRKTIIMWGWKHVHLCVFFFCGAVPKCAYEYVHMPACACVGGVFVVVISPSPHIRIALSIYVHRTWLVTIATTV